MSTEKVPNKNYGNEKLSECIETLHLDSETADVYFEVIGDDGTVERVPAHKNLLAAVSNVFKAMFYGQLKEEGDVKLTDVTAEAMKEFLQFFYMRKVEPTMENITEVMHLGHKYNVTKCVDVCVQFLIDSLTDENICTGLGLALLYDQKVLLKFCEKRISVNTEAVFKSTTFLECDKRTLEHILNMNLLSCSEIAVFEACMSWVKAKSNQDELTKETIQTYLGESFYEIRFTSMTAEDFIMLNASHDHLFSRDEYKDIAYSFPPSRTCPKQFNGNPRQVQWDKAAVVKCDRVKPNGVVGYCKMDKDYTTTLSSNELVLLGGFICTQISVFRENNQHDLRSDLPIEVSIVEISDLNETDEKSNNILSNLKTTLPSQSEKLISLAKPVLIRPGYFYKLHMKLYPEGHCYRYKELMTSVKIANDIVLKFHNDMQVKNEDTVVSPITALEFNPI